MCCLLLHFGVSRHPLDEKTRYNVRFEYFLFSIGFATPDSAQGLQVTTRRPPLFNNAWPGHRKRLICSVEIL